VAGNTENAASGPAGPEAGAPVVELDGLDRHFGERTVLAGISLTLGHGQTLAVLGRNGAGKSTLLRILATLLRPHEGTVKLFGEPLPRQGWKVRGRVGLLGHEPLLYRDLTGRENLDYHARLHRVTADRVEQVLEQVGMEERADDPVRSLSRGMVQRLTVARAVLHQPQLLLLDEPRSNLDPAAGALVEPLIGKAAGVTRVLTSHDPSAALKEADLVLALAGGRTAYLGSPEGLDDATLRSLYA
jgi:heme exporter protein A